MANQSCSATGLILILGRTKSETVRFNFIFYRLFCIILVRVYLNCRVVRSIVCGGWSVSRPTDSWTCTDLAYFCIVLFNLSVSVLQPRFLKCSRGDVEFSVHSVVQQEEYVPYIQCIFSSGWLARMYLSSAPLHGVRPEKRERCRLHTAYCILHRIETVQISVSLP